MMKQFPEYKQFDLSQINKEIQAFWKANRTFEKSIETREGHPEFVFYEGPPSANGTPGIHHVMARTIKDLFCRYKTLQGFQVKRKAGWDTHGLPVEIGVEKKLGITKDEIGQKISVEKYNAHCRKDVMKYTGEWERLTDEMGYWVNMNDPYITYDNKYIETLWYLLKQMYSKDLLYKGYTIQPYSPAAGTGLSTHELNQPGCYKDVKDTTVVAQFKVVKNTDSGFLFNEIDSDLFFIAWTTTPWTLLSNTALAINQNITYIKVRTYNIYTGQPITVILAKDRFSIYFNPKDKDLPLDSYEAGNKHIPYRIVEEFKGEKIVGLRYEQLLPYQQPEDGDAFRVVHGDFVTTEEGTGIVHIAPSFGADDFMVAKKNGIGSLTLVNKKGQFIDGVGEFSGRYVKNAYLPEISADDNTVDIDIAVKLKQENKNFKTEKYEHSYPHCWRTDKPILYYPLDSWFIKTTAYKPQMIALNKTINWKPKSTGEGRFGQWLENLMDWNLSRSRFWGTPLPIWTTEDREEQICIGSIAELKQEIEKAVAVKFMSKNPIADFNENDFSKANYDKFDLHRPFVDDIILVSPSGKKMFREPDLIDVWFDSGAMPYAQLHYPFEHKDDFEKYFPADFIAEGVDQTRGWFFTLHAIATMLFDSVAFKNIISNGLVLDKKGNKMSKRLGNAVNPFDMIEKYGSDNLRWYMISNSQPWDNLKFDEEGVTEVKRKFFGTLYNTYSFFVLYANIDRFQFKESLIPVAERREIDRWIISLLNSLIKEVYGAFESYEPTRAARAIQSFVNDHLSNWFVRLNRKRFWGGKYDQDKIAAYQTLYEALMKVSILIAPIAPFYAEKLFRDLNAV
ncbi:MAG: isoleucine--tRNA ligase, partial [Bacteroidales bacterium]|nr:isoleucine--tRNA ligase [Bacteroidales bacterium]